MPAARDVIFRIIGEDLTSPAFNRAATTAETASARVTRAGDRMAVAGRKMTSHLTLPILGIAAASIKMASDFQASMTRIQTQAGASARDVQILSRQVLGLAKTAQQGPNELAGALYHLKSVGLDNVGAMKALRQSSDLAAVGNANLEETANALAGAWRTGIKGAKDFHSAAATVNAIIGAGNMTLTDFNAALGTGILPSAKTFGLTLKDVGSALALFTDEGIASDAAATRLRMSFSLLAAPSMAAEKVLRGIGLTGHQLGETMRKPEGLIKTIGLLKSHLEGLSNYYPNSTAADNFVSANYARFQSLAGIKMKDLSASQRAFVNQYGMAKDNHEVLAKSRLDAAEQAAVLSKAFGGGRSSSAILSLINNYDVLKKKQDQVTRSLGKYDQAVKTQRQTASAQFHETLASLQRSAVMIGTDLLPVAKDLAHAIGGAADGFSGLSTGTKKLIVEGGLALAALGPLLAIGGRLVKLFATVGLWASKAALFMAAPFRAAAVSAETGALVIQESQLSEQLAVKRSAALIAVAEADKANAAAESAVRIAVAVEGTSSVLAAGASAAALDAIDFAAAQQLAADAAVRAAAETDVAWTTAQTSLRTQMALTKTSSFGMQSAIAGLGIGLTVGTLDQNASTTTKVLGTLGSTAAGAAVGFSMGGPLGAAIGGLAGGLSSLVGWFHHTSSAADDAAKAAAAFLNAENDAAQNLLGTLEQVNGQYNLAAKHAVLGQLQRTGVLNQTANLGINPGQLLHAAMGNQSELERIYAQIYKSSGVPFIKGTHTFDPGSVNFKAAKQIADALAAVVAGGQKAERTFELEQRALGKTLVPAKLLAGGMKNLNREFTKSRDLNLWDAAVKLGAYRMQKFNDAIGGTSAEAQRNTAVIRANIDKLQRQAAQQLENNRGLAAVTKTYRAHIFALEAEVIQSGFNKKAVQELFAAYGTLPQNIVTKIRAEDHATAALRALQNYIKTHSWSVNLGINAHGDKVKYFPGYGPVTVHHPAAGGYITGPGSGTSDSIPAWLSNGEYVVNARATARHRPMLEALNTGTPAFAAGGPVARQGASPQPLNVRIYVGDREITDIVRVEVDDALSYQAHTGRMHAR